MFAAVLIGGVLFASPATKVYYGTVQDAKKPAEIVASTVFNEIPEYKKIKDSGLTQDDPEYIILLNKANTKFFAAVARAAGLTMRDVVVEKGSAVFSSEVVDLTKKVIDSLDK